LNTRLQFCAPELFPEVEEYIKQFELDSRELSAEQFLTLTRSGKLIGFGRLRKYGDFSELCSLGVIKEEREKGYGSRIIRALSISSKSPVFAVCINPSLFETLGFEICETYPSEIKEKLDYCRTCLPVEETYVVVKKVLV
jgi:N-acetylglutamate synthase-like GNAT family acetyltransferase